ncbi:transcriptional regulator [Microvirga sp. 2MCAF38]|uniref:transcriptional regulator n=1 Tax=Microvirga sp. 2MCAF38 TaxID=3232989 RepID=UPI003F99A147
MIEQTHPHLSEFLAFLKELNKETERGAALAAAAMIDDLLGKALQAFLIENKGAQALLSGFNAPLGTFSSKIAAAYALGVISEREYRECELIRKIRNEFAHKVQISFESQALADMCRALSFSAPDYGDVVVGIRGKFTSAAVALILNLTNRPHYVGLKRLTHQAWPY